MGKQERIQKWKAQIVGKRFKSLAEIHRTADCNPSTARAWLQELEATHEIIIDHDGAVYDGDMDIDKQAYEEAIKKLGGNEAFVRLTRRQADAVKYALRAVKR